MEVAPPLKLLTLITLISLLYGFMGFGAKKKTHRQTHIHSLLIQWPASTSALIGRRLNQSELARSGPAGDDTFGKPYQVWVAI